LVDRTQRHDAGDVDRVEGRLLVAHTRKVDDDVRPLDPDVGFGDAAALELVADQVADDEQVVAGGAAGRSEDDREATLEVEAEGRRVTEAEVEPQKDDRHADDGGDRHPQASNHSVASPADLSALSAVDSGSSAFGLAL
jgi:hypothetical protein